MLYKFHDVILVNHGNFSINYVLDFIHKGLVTVCPRFTL